VEGAIITLPYVEDKLKIDLRLTMNSGLGQRVGSDTQTYWIVNKSSVELSNPAPGWQLETGSQVLLRFMVKDISGVMLSPEKVSWQESRNGTSWTAVKLGGGAVLAVPATIGAYYLKASFEEAPGHSTERQFDFQVVNQASFVKIELGNPRASEHSMGGVLGEQASGKVYGFSSDHTDRVGYFWVIEGGSWAHGYQPMRLESFIKLVQGENFKVMVGTGRVKVTLRLGPVEGRGIEVGVNGKRIQLPVSFDEHVVKVVTETVSASGVLLITGSADLPLMDVIVEQLEAGAPAVTDTVNLEHMDVLGHANGNYRDIPGAFGKNFKFDWIWRCE
jgi:hypothetical protein